MTMYGNITLRYSGEKMDYILDVLFDTDTNKKSMPSLSFYHNYGMLKDEKNIDVWDNDSYLIDVLLNNVLIPWVDYQNIKVTEDFTSLLQMDGFKMEDFKGLKLLLEKGIELGFFEEYFEKKGKK